VFPPSPPPLPPFLPSTPPLLLLSQQAHSTVLSAKRRQGFPPNGREWRSADLTLSHRLTRPMVACVNAITGAQCGIRSERDGPPVRLVECSVERFPDFLIHEVFKAGNYKPEDIVIMFRCINKWPHKPYVTRLINALSLLGWPVCAPDEDARGSEACERGKVLFSTFASMKGRERDCAVVVGLNDGLADHPGDAAGAGTGVCGKDLYVALTRGRKELVLIQLVSHDPLPYAPPLDAPYMRHVPPEPADLAGVKRRPPSRSQPPRGGKPKSVVEFVRHRSEAAMSAAVGHLDIQEVVHPLGAPGQLSLPAEVPQGRLTEFVSDFNGVSLQLLLEMSLGAPLDAAAAAALADIRRERCSGGVPALGAPPIGAVTVSEALEVALRLDQKKTGRIHRRRQIKKTDWLAKATASNCVARLRALLALALGVTSDAALNALAARRLKFEHPLGPREVPDSGSSGGCSKIHGAVDAFDTVRGLPIEIKCTSAPAAEHTLQLALYMLLAGAQEGFLIYPLSLQVLRVRATPAQLRAAVACMTRRIAASGDQFLADCRRRW
jgi:hypothetical protein